MRHPSHGANCPPAACRGFTLIEVLVALAVLAFALSAIGVAIVSSARNGTYLEQRTLAEWVASNRLTELRVTRAWPDTGRSDGKTNMGGRSWRWQLEVSATPLPQLRRVEISVGEADGQESLTHLVGYLRQP